MWFYVTGRRTGARCRTEDPINTSMNKGRGAEGGLPFVFKTGQLKNNNLIVNNRCTSVEPTKHVVVLFFSDQIQIRWPLDLRALQSLCSPLCSYRLKFFTTGGWDHTLWTNRTSTHRLFSWGTRKDFCCGASVSFKISLSGLGWNVWQRDESFEISAGTHQQECTSQCFLSTEGCCAFHLVQCLKLTGLIQRA